MASFIHRCVKNDDKNDVLIPLIEVQNPKIREVVVNKSYSIKNPPHIKGTGYVVQSLEAALWSFYTTNTFEEGMIKAVNLGNDADTTGAVYGQLAGAYYGYDSIPKRWIESLYKHDYIYNLALSLSNTTIDTDRL
jgi:ADP-ribosylglycohydrolase